MEELFRRNLNMLMVENGISQTDLAAKLGFPRQTLGNWIAGTARPNGLSLPQLIQMLRHQLRFQSRRLIVVDPGALFVGQFIPALGPGIQAKLLYSDLDIPKAEKPAPAGALILSEGSVDYSSKNTPPDALRRLLAYAVLLNDGDLDMVADMAERLAGKDGKR